MVKYDIDTDSMRAEQSAIQKLGILNIAQEIYVSTAPHFIESDGLFDIADGIEYHANYTTKNVVTKLS